MLSHSAEMALIGPVFIPLVISLILFTSASRTNKPKLFLSLAMLNVAFVFFGNFLYFAHHLHFYSLLHGFHIFAVLAIYPSLYIYFSLLIHPTISYKKLALHFLPALVFLILSDALFFPFLTVKERIYFLGEYRLHPTFDTIWLKALWIIRYVNVVVIFIQIPFYSYKIYKLQKEHNRVIANSFSSPWEVNMNWLKILNFTLIASGFLCIFFYAINPQKLFGDERYLTYPFYLLSAVISIIGVYGNNQKLIFKEEEVLYSCDDTNAEENANGNSINFDLQKRLEHYFENQKPYLKPDLKIWEVCSELGSNRTYISKLINDKYGMNFCQFVNKYRIQHATDLMQKEGKMKAEEIAVVSGFGSFASYHRAKKSLESEMLCE